MYSFSSYLFIFILFTCKTDIFKYSLTFYLHHLPKITMVPSFIKFVVLTMTTVILCGNQKMSTFLIHSIDLESLWDLLPEVNFYAAYCFSEKSAFIDNCFCKF